MNANVKSDSRTILAHVVALWLACALVASNAVASDTRSESVKFGDLNLSSQAGVETLYERIHAAAKRVCEQPAGELGATRSCVKKAEGEAIGKVNLPLLTALYEQKTGTHPQSIIASR
jgi:UrcA family protein